MQNNRKNKTTKLATAKEDIFLPLRKMKKNMYGSYLYKINTNISK